MSKKLTKEIAAFRARQAEEEAYEDLRDDVMSIVRNHGMSYEDIHARFGPTPQTLQKWDMKEVKKPTLGKLQSTLHIFNKDIGIIDGSRK